MDEKLDPLCCCEYFDRNDERNHILACCCNCTDLDECVDGLIRGRGVSEENKAGLVATMQDRMRIPWRGGAKQVAIDALLPVIILPIMLLLSSISLWWTIFAFTTVLVFIVIISNFLIKRLPNTKFFFMWTLTSIIILYIVFEFLVIPFLEILLEENIALSIIIGAFLLCLYLSKMRTTYLGCVQDLIENGAMGKPGRSYNCSICQVYVPEKDHHCLWFDCCIGKHNQCLFLLTLLFALMALIYSSNLTLTAVCHPFRVFDTSVLLPDDCSEVYQQFELSLSFVTALYSLGLACFICLLFLHQLWIISIGLTGREWRNLPLISKLLLGLNVSRPHNRGFFKNWSRILCLRHPSYNLI